MRSQFKPSADLSGQLWFLMLLAAYTVLELSFNHRLLEVAQAITSGLDATGAQAMERWARVVSGLGLGLLLMRWLQRWIPSRFWLVLSCIAAGLLVMWHLQKAVVDAIVASADNKDLQMSVHAHLSTGEALKGRIELRGQPILSAPASGELRQLMGALWPSSVLGLSPEDLESVSGAVQLIGGWSAPIPSGEQMRHAYRKAVMMPVALGSSLLFGLLNLCQLMAGLVILLLSWLRAERLRQLSERWLLHGLVVLCMSMSWWPGNVWVDSSGYREIARPALWQELPVLAPFVEWSLRAELAWSDPVAWFHRHLLRDFDFRDPLQ